MLQHGHPPSSLSGRGGTKKPGRAGADDEDVEMGHAKTARVDLELHRMQAALGQFAKGPLIFRDELFDDRLLLERGREHFPGVGLHFKMMAKFRMGFDFVQRAKEMVGRRAEKCGGFCV